MSTLGESYRNALAGVKLPPAGWPAPVLATWAYEALRAAVSTVAADSLPVSWTGWRSKDPSDRQVAATLTALGGLRRDTSVPQPHRQALAQIQASASNLTRGDVPDFLSVGFALPERRRQKLPTREALPHALDALAAAATSPRTRSEVSI